MIAWPESIRDKKWRSAVYAFEFTSAHLARYHQNMGDLDACIEIASEALYDVPASELVGRPDLLPENRAMEVIYRMRGLLKQHNLAKLCATGEKRGPLPLYALVPNPIDPDTYPT